MSVDGVEQGMEIEVVEQADHDGGNESLAPMVQDFDDRNDRLMAMVIQSGNIDAFEKFIALREREEDRQAEKEFNLHFAKMQGEFLPVKKVKEAYDAKANKSLYNYVPLDELQKTYDSIITKHGFSYWWREEALEKGNKRSIMTISGHGHSRETFFDVPTIQPTQYQNAIQVAGTMSTYGRRYTYIAGFPVVIEDEDSDAILPGTGAEYAEDAGRLQSCGTPQELMASWRAIYPKIQNDQSAMRYLSSVKENRLKEIRNVR